MTQPERRLFERIYDLSFSPDADFHCDEVVVVDDIRPIVAEFEQRLAEAERDARRYQWLRDVGAFLEVVSSPSMNSGRGPFIAFNPPACNQFQQITLQGSVADLFIDASLTAPLPEKTHE